MKFLTYGLMLIVSMMILIGATIEYIYKYTPVIAKLSQIHFKKSYSYLYQRIGRYFKKPTYSY